MSDNEETRGRKVLPDDLKRSFNIHVSLTKEETHLLDAFAASTGRNRSNAIRKILRDFFRLTP